MDVIGKLIKGILIVLSKLFGLTILLFSATTLIGLAFGLFSAGSLDYWGQGDLLEYYQAVSMMTFPFWALMIIVFLSVGLPLLLYLSSGLSS